MSKFPQKPYDPAGAKPSPGPWWREQDCYIYSQGMDPVARVFIRGSKTSPAQDEAYLNACLITAAPDMLAELKKCEMVFRRLSGANSPDAGIEPCVDSNLLAIADSLRDVIAKAEGRK